MANVMDLTRVNRFSASRYILLFSLSLSLSERNTQRDEACKLLGELHNSSRSAAFSILIEILEPH